MSETQAITVEKVLAYPGGDDLAHLDHARLDRDMVDAE